jgi:hypothetical protein
VIEDMAEPDDEGLLRELGRVEPPAAAVLEAAREALWSAVAGEMLGPGPAGGAASRTGAGRQQGESRRRAEPGLQQGESRRQAEPGR